MTVSYDFVGSKFFPFFLFMSIDSDCHVTGEAFDDVRVLLDVIEALEIFSVLVGLIPR